MANCYERQKVSCRDRVIDETNKPALVLV